MKRSMRLILDANEYIFGMDKFSGRTWSIMLLEAIGNLLREEADFALFVPDIIRDEVQRNIDRRFLSDFYRFISSDPRIVYGSLFEVPVSLFEKYRQEIGLKEADAVIAAFAEWKAVDFVVSENRHIYEELKVDEFITCNAEEFIKLLESGEIWQVIEELRANK